MRRFPREYLVLSSFQRKICAQLLPLALGIFLPGPAKMSGDHEAEITQ